jgi:6-phosphogluconolactonase
VSEVWVTEDVPAAAAELFVEAAAGAVAARGKASVALTGGSTAPPLFERLLHCNVPWAQLLIFFTDERAVPPDHPLSNYKAAKDGLLDRVRPASVHRLRGEAPDLDEEARAAAVELRQAMGEPPRLDLALLGLGPDGHICSLFAGVPSSADRGEKELVRHVAAPEHVEPHVERLTLVPFLIVTARMVVLQASGAKKADLLATVLKGPEDLIACPGQWLRKAVGRVVIVADGAAAARL